MKKIVRIFIYNFFSFANFFFLKNKKNFFIYDNTFRKDNLWVIKEFLEKDVGNKVFYYVNKGSLKKHQLLSTNTTIYNSNILLGLFHQFTSKYVFYDHGAYRFTVRNNSSQVIVNTWHGTPLKKIGYQKGDKPILGYSANFNFLISPSSFFDEIFMKSFGADKNQILKSGYPRNDRLFINNPELNNLFNIENKKIFVWLPTYRVSNENNLFDSTLEFPLLNNNNFESFLSFLKLENIIVVLKPHPFMELPFFLMESDNFKIIGNDFMFKNKLDLNDLYIASTALITDYSSVFF